MRLFFVLAVCLILAAIPMPSLLADVSYTGRAIPAIKTATPPMIDGDISDSAWSAASKADTFIDLQTGKPVGDQTSAMILYDKENIYVAFHARDSQPDRITARETIQDYRFGSFNFDNN